MVRLRYQRGDLLDSDCTPALDVNKPLRTAQIGGNETVNMVVPTQTMDSLEGSFSMALGDPGSEDLPAGSLFRVLLDVTAAGPNLTYVVQFHALNTVCGSLGVATQLELPFSGTGLKLATATWDPPAGTDRYQARILVTHGGMRGAPDETLTLRTNNANAWYEIPDAPLPPGGMAVISWIQEGMG